MYLLLLVARCCPRAGLHQVLLRVWFIPDPPGVWFKTQVSNSAVPQCPHPEAALPCSDAPFYRDGGGGAGFLCFCQDQRCLTVSFPG